MNSAARLPPDVESLLDLHIFYPLAQTLNHHLHGKFFGLVSPNNITTFGNVIRVLIVYALRGKWCPSLLIFVGFFLQYLADCMDGMWARQYGSASEFGQQYGKNLPTHAAYSSLLCVWQTTSQTGSLGQYVFGS
jgi:hypothetical protein